MVGGVVGLALIAGLAWWFLRRRKQTNAVATSQPEQSPADMDAKHTQLPPQAQYGRQAYEVEGNQHQELYAENPPKAVNESALPNYPYSQEPPATDPHVHPAELDGDGVGRR